MTKFEEIVLNILKEQKEFIQYPITRFEFIKTFSYTNELLHEVNDFIRTNGNNIERIKSKYFNENNKNLDWLSLYLVHDSIQQEYIAFILDRVELWADPELIQLIKLER
jgi:hypothetical protein